ncbi:MAG: hypothetical protein ABI414_01805 [Devosia sp.]
MKRITLLLAFSALLGAPAVLADDAALTFGGDQYVAGQASPKATPVGHDAFALGNDVIFSAAGSGDAHPAGRHVNVNADVSCDIYAADFFGAAPVETMIRRSARDAPRVGGARPLVAVL